LRRRTFSQDIRENVRAFIDGHSWILHVFVDGSIDVGTGFVKDFAEISNLVKPLIDRLDHRHLGAWSVPWTGLDWSYNSMLSYREHNGERHPWAVDGLAAEFYPSSENLLVWIGARLKDSGLDWSKLEIEETCTSSALLTRSEFEGYGPQGSSGNI